LGGKVEELGALGGIDWQDDDDDDDVRQSLNQSWPVVQRLLLLVAGTLHFDRSQYGLLFVF